MNFDAADLTIGALSIVLSAGAYWAATRQVKLSAAAFLSEWRRDVRNWASEAVDVLVDSTRSMRESPDPSESERSLSCSRLSALVDRGRLLFPNFERDGAEAGKPLAFRGYRHYALDPLLAAHGILEGRLSPGAFPDAEAALIGVRREFVSAVQAIIDPESANEKIEAFLARENVDYMTDLGVKERPDGTFVPLGAEGILRVASERFRARDQA